MSADGQLLLVLHEPPRAGETRRRGRLFWRSADGAWQSNTLGPGIGALQKHLNEYLDLIEQLDKAEERADLADEFFRLLREIAPLHRAAGNMYDTLQEARDLVREDHDLIVCRDEAYHVYRSVELLQGDAKIGLDCAIARRAEEDAQSSYRMAVAGHRLNVLAAIFFPIATIASIFGMNLDHGLGETDTPWLFWVLVLGSVACGFFLRAAIVERPPRSKKIDRVKSV
jgi:Mg2+ and Co2+ transporter CorA